MALDYSRVESELIANRRLFHAHAESGFTEFWTASRIASTVRDLGYELKVGRQIMADGSRMGVPSAEVLKACRERALSEGADPELLERMDGGYTAVAGVLENGPGPVIGLRFDMDAVDVDESESPDHLPRKEGFASAHAGVMHACGHDGHMSIGLAVARLLAENRGMWKGTVKLIFQPAEEGVRGARSIADSGFLDDADYFLSGHIGMFPDGSGTFFSRIGGFLSTTKLDVRFEGNPAHAGADPEKGRNALLAAASAALHIMGIPRHSEGATRVNIGRLEAGSGRNVIPGKAFLAMETRGATSALNEYMASEANRILEGAARMYDVRVSVERMGEAQSATSDPDLMEAAAACAADAGYVRVVRDEMPMGGSEDCTFLMNRVRDRGGKALYAVFGTTLSAPHHNSRFDLREEDLIKAARLLFLLVGRLSS